ncbi:GxxExxY protein [bacterium]|nr:GxxExxY protein [bacterium]
MSGYMFEEQTYKIIGACMEVHKQLGCGFLEAVYQEALGIEFNKQNIPYQREVSINIHYKDKLLDKKYIADFICYDNIIVELKALNNITNDHHAQVINYLKATSYPVGLLINFGERSLYHKRLILY